MWIRLYRGNHEDRCVMVDNQTFIYRLNQQHKNWLFETVFLLKKMYIASSHYKEQYIQQINDNYLWYVPFKNCMHDYIYSLMKTNGISSCTYVAWYGLLSCLAHCTRVKRWKVCVFRGHFCIPFLELRYTVGDPELQFTFRCTRETTVYCSLVMFAAI